MALCICRNCNREFNCKPSQITKGGGKYCSRKCQYTSSEFKQKIRDIANNPKYKEIKRQNIKKAHEAIRGKPAWNRGIERPESVKQAVSRANKGRLANENNPNWKGDLVSEEALHSWVARRLGRPRKCDFCGDTQAKKYEWANRSHQYLREVTDWYRLCVSCHKRYDKVRVGEKNHDRKALFEERRRLRELRKVPH